MAEGGHLLRKAPDPYPPGKAKSQAKFWRTSQKIGTIIFWLFYPPGPKDLLRKEKGWLIDVYHNSRWHIKWAKHAAPNSKFEKMALLRYPWWWHLQRLKGPDHMVEGGHHLRNRTQPPPTFHIAETFKELLDLRVHIHFQNAPQDLQISSLNTT